MRSKSMFDSYLALRNVAHHAFSNSLLLFEKGCDRDKPEHLFSKPQSLKRNIGFDTSANSKKIVRSSPWTPLWCQGGNFQASWVVLICCEEVMYLDLWQLMGNLLLSHREEALEINRTVNLNSWNNQRRNILETIVSPQIWTQKKLQQIYSSLKM